MIARKIRRIVAALVMVCATGSAAAFSYGILAAGVLAGAIAVVAAPYVGIALTTAEIAGVLGSSTINSALAAYVFGQPVKPAPSMPPVMVTMINNSARTAAPVKVNLSPMSSAAKQKYQAAKQAAQTAAAVVPTSGSPASGQSSAQATASSNVQGAVRILQDANPSGHPQTVCRDNAPTPSVRCFAACAVGPG